MVARTIDSIAIRGEGLFLLLGRLAIAALFVRSGLDKLLDLTGFERIFAARGLPLPVAWALVAALIEFLGGLAVAIGVRTRFAALLLIIFTVAANSSARGFWTSDSNVLNDLAIIGGLLYVFVRGAGAIALDRR